MFPGPDDTDDLLTDDIPAVGHGIWTRILGEDAGPTPVPFTATPGPRRIPGPTTTPLDYIQLFLTDTFIDLIVTETNNYAAQWIQSHQVYLQTYPKSRVHQWIKQGNTSREEMKAFLSIVMNMGIVKKTAIARYWDITNPSQSTPWFVEHMWRDRFILLLKFLHFNDNTAMPAPEHPDYKLYKVQPVIDNFKAKFLNFYVPNRDVAIDESMVGYRGKTPHLRQYMPNKHHARFGIKLWLVCDSKTHYSCNFEVYKGAHAAADAAAEEGTTYALVRRLMEETDLLHQGYHLGCDNFFSSPKLFLDLFDDQTTATGTVRSNRVGLPKQMLKEPLARGQVGERRRGPLLCVAYKDNNRRPVLLSTKAFSGFEDTRNARGREVRRPRIVNVYNSAMGGVDASDARLYAYVSERRTIKWTLKLFFSLFGRACLNAFIIYNEHYTGTDKLQRLDFLICGLELMMGNYAPGKLPRKRRSQADIALAAQAPQPAVHPPQHDYQPAAPSCKLEKIGDGKRRMCMHERLKNKKTVWQCAHCKVTMCPSCFIPYHKKRNMPV